MNTGSYLKRRVVFFLLSFIFIIIALILTFFYLRNARADKDVNLDTKNLTVSFQNADKGLQFGRYPMSFQQGIEGSPDNIYTIVNKTDLSTSFEVVVSLTRQDIDNIDANKVVVAVNDADLMYLGNCEAGVVYESSIPPNSQEELNLKFWLAKELVTESDLEKSLSLNVSIKEK